MRKDLFELIFKLHDFFLLEIEAKLVFCFSETILKLFFLFLESFEFCF